jgi:hypothetical protein
VVGSCGFDTSTSSIPRVGFTILQRFFMLGFSQAVVLYQLFGLVFKFDTITSTSSIPRVGFNILQRFFMLCFSQAVAL